MHKARSFFLTCGLLIALATHTLVPSAASASTITTVTIDIAASQNGSVNTPVSALNQPGITFLGEPTTRSYIDRFAPWIAVDSTSISGGPIGAARMSVSVTGGRGINLAYGFEGSTALNVTLTLKLRGVTVGTPVNISTNSAWSNFISTENFDELLVDVPISGTTESARFFIRTLSFQIESGSGAPSVLSVPPMAPMQGVDLPESGNCTDVNEAVLTWAADVNGGWYRSWQSWVIASMPEQRLWEGWACVREIVWTPTGWTATLTR